MTNYTGFATAMLAAAMLAGCAGAQKPMDRLEETLEMRAVVVAIDQARRLVTVKSEDAELVLEAAGTIKNLDQIQVGDEVALKVTETLAWQVRPGGKDGPGVSTGAAISTAPPGAKPSVTGKRSVQFTVSITAIDLEQGTVTLTGAEGRSRTVRARDPNNLKRVKVGDLLDLTYTEAIALDVRSTKGQ